MGLAHVHALQEVSFKQVNGKAPALRTASCLLPTKLTAGIEVDDALAAWQLTGYGNDSSRVGAQCD